MDGRRSWTDIRNEITFEASNYRAYRVGIGDALNEVVDSICVDLAVCEKVEYVNTDIILGKYDAAKTLLDKLVEVNRQHEEALSKMLTVEIRNRISYLEEETEDDVKSRNEEE